MGLCAYCRLLVYSRGSYERAKSLIELVVTRFKIIEGSRVNFPVSTVAPGTMANIGGQLYSYATVTTFYLLHFIIQISLQFRHRTHGTLEVDYLWLVVYVNRNTVAGSYIFNKRAVNTGFVSSIAGLPRPGGSWWKGIFPPREPNGMVFAQIRQRSSYIELITRFTSIPG